MWNWSQRESSSATIQYIICQQQISMPAHISWWLSSSSFMQFNWQSLYCAFHLGCFSLPTLSPFTASHYAHLPLPSTPFSFCIWKGTGINVMCWHWRLLCSVLGDFSFCSPYLPFHEGSWKGKEVCSPYPGHFTCGATLSIIIYCDYFYEFLFTIMVLTGNRT